jgi:hypothetical protein
MPDPTAPTAVTLFSYQMGFGDCFLLRFHYPDPERDRHVLIDFGTTRLPPGAPKDQPLLVARDIEAKVQENGARLDAIVATHRHSDHISGFATKADGSGSGDIIRALKPTIVIQPWTEAPDADEDTLGPEISSSERSMGQKLAALQAMHGVAERAVKMLDGKGLKRAPQDVRDQIEFIGSDNIRNASAVRNLMTMTDKPRYVYHGADAGLDELLPGVTTIVLGPPTLAQTEDIRKQRSRDPDEYWHLSLQGLDADASLHTDEDEDRLFPGHPVFPAGRMPMEVMWFRDRLDQARAGQMLSIVRGLDKQMNNTSVILLFEVGGKKLLFPGDAQIENWRYALESEYASKLDDVDLYKVGHHGSLNATPRSMWARFSKKSEDQKDAARLKTVMSTLPGKHGSEDDHTEVPRLSLLKELEKESDLHSTHQMEPGVLYQEIRIDL